MAGGFALAEVVGVQAEGKADDDFAVQGADDFEDSVIRSPGEFSVEKLSLGGAEPGVEEHAQVGLDGAVEHGHGKPRFLDGGAHVAFEGGEAVQVEGVPPLNCLGGASHQKQRQGCHHAKHASPAYHDIGCEDK